MASSVGIEVRCRVRRRWLLSLAVFVRTRLHWRWGAVQLAALTRVEYQAGSTRWQSIPNRKLREALRERGTA
jgi:hypothetical protein